VNTVNAKSGPFHCLLCVGQFLANDADSAQQFKEYVSGQKSVPIPTYFIGDYGEGAEELSSQVAGDSTGKGQICENLFYLRGAGIREIAGLRVAFLSGKYDKLTYEDTSRVAVAAAIREGGCYLKHQVEELLQKNDPSIVVDVLMTNEWPLGVTHNLSVCSPAHAALSQEGRQVTAEIVEKLGPRYHLCGMGDTYFARSPYKTTAGHVTRFVALANVGNAQKQKWLYAVSLKPAAQMSQTELATVPTDTTSTPYTHANPQTLAGHKRKLEAGSSRAGVGAPPSDMEAKYAALEEQSNEMQSTQNFRWQEPQVKKLRPDMKKPLGAARLNGSTVIFVKNLHFKAREEELAKFFGDCGNVIDVNIGREQDGRSRGFAHITFTSTEEAVKACNKHGQVFMGREMFVDGHEQRPKLDPNIPQYIPGTGNIPPPPAGPPPGTPASCWFCLSNAEADVNLVVSIGEHTYLAIDKGPLVAEHVLLVTIEHIPCTLRLSDAGQGELTKYSDALKKCFESGGCKLLMFERYMALRSKGGNHCHVNCMAIPNELADQAGSVFRTKARDAGFDFEIEISADIDTMEARRQLDKATDGGRHEFVMVTLPDGVRLVHVLSRGERHPMSFCREAAANALGVPEKADWKNCRMTLHEENEASQAFKTKFGQFDPFMQ